MNSPFGVLYQIVKETGWTMHYILWKVGWSTIMMMLADRPGFKKGKGKEKEVKKGSSADLKNLIKRKYG
jgi:hypothetical protein